MKITLKRLNVIKIAYSEAEAGALESRGFKVVARENDKPPKGRAAKKGEQEDADLKEL